MVSLADTGNKNKMRWGSGKKKRKEKENDKKGKKKKKEEKKRKSGGGGKCKNKKEGRGWVQGVRGAWVLRRVGPLTNNARST